MKLSSASSAVLQCVLLVLIATTTRCDDVNPDLYEALRDSLISDKSNLLKLQNLFYNPTNEIVSPVIAICKDDFKVLNISKNWNRPDGAFVYNDELQSFLRSTNDSDYCDLGFSTCDLYNSFYIISRDATSFLQLATYFQLEYYDNTQFIDYTFFTFMTYFTGTVKRDVNESYAYISLHIPYLLEMPSSTELQSTLEEVFSWVCDTDTATNYSYIVYIKYCL